MTEQEENELICEKLLGWVRGPTTSRVLLGQAWQRANDPAVLRTPQFTTWADVGLILDAIVAKGGYYNLGMGSRDEPKEGPWVKLLIDSSAEWAKNYGRGETMPEAIRAAVLDAIASLPVSP